MGTTRLTGAIERAKAYPKSDTERNIIEALEEVRDLAQLQTDLLSVIAKKAGVSDADIDAHFAELVAKEGPLPDRVDAAKAVINAKPEL